MFEDIDIDAAKKKIAEAMDEPLSILRERLVGKWTLNVPTEDALRKMKMVHYSIGGNVSAYIDKYASDGHAIVPFAIENIRFVSETVNSQNFMKKIVLDGKGENGRYRSRTVVIGDEDAFEIGPLFDSAEAAKVYLELRKY